MVKCSFFIYIYIFKVKVYLFGLFALVDRCGGTNYLLNRLSEGETKVYILIYVSIFRF
jgi:hypothetical protein